MAEALSKKKTKNCSIQIAKFSSSLLFSALRKVLRGYKNVEMDELIEMTEAMERRISIGNKNKSYIYIIYINETHI